MVNVVRGAEGGELAQSGRPLVHIATRSPISSRCAMPRTRISLVHSGEGFSFA